MTTTADKTLTDVVNDANPNNVNDAFRRMQLGDILTPQKRAISQAAAAVVVLDPPAQGMATTYANVTAGAAAAGVRTIADDTEAPSATLATLSDDGTTLTFEANVTDVVVDYIPRSAVDMSSDFAVTGLD
jgi:hypothetical protein